MCATACWTSGADQVAASGSSGDASLGAASYKASNVSNGTSCTGVISVAQPRCRQYSSIVLISRVATRSSPSQHSSPM
eukprot:2148860-Amphidinium_carterae.2